MNHFSVFYILLQSSSRTRSYIYFSSFAFIPHSRVTLNTWLALVSFRSGPKIDIDQPAELLTQHRRERIFAVHANNRSVRREDPFAVLYLRPREGWDLSRSPVTDDFRATSIPRLNPFANGQTQADAEINDRPVNALWERDARVHLTAPLFHIEKTWDRRSRLASPRHENGRTPRAAGHYKMHNSWHLGWLNRYL